MNSDELVLERPEAVCLQRLNQAVAISRKMLKCAQMEEWQKLILLESERSQLLSEFFRESVNESESTDVAFAIQLIKSLDKKTMQHVRVEHESVSNELKKLNKGRRVSHAYLQ